MDLTALKALAYDKAVLIERYQRELVNLNRTIAEHQSRTHLVKSQQAEPEQKPEPENPAEPKKEGE